MNLLLDTHVLIWWDDELVAHLPVHHRDPFDRLLIAQAEGERLTLVTRDPVFQRYSAATIEA